MAITNHYVNEAPFRTASVYEDETTETITVEMTQEGGVIKVEYYGAGREFMTLARLEALNWARYGSLDVLHESPSLSSVN